MLVPFSASNFSARDLLRIAVSTLIALLLIRIVGAVLGLAAYPGITFVYGHANRALGAASFAVNIVAVLISIWTLSVSLKIARGSSAGILRRNELTLAIARLAAIVVAVEVTFGFVAGEVNNLLVVNLGNATQIDFGATVWFVVVAVAIPAALLALVLIFSARWFAPREGL